MGLEGPLDDANGIRATPVGISGGQEAECPLTIGTEGAFALQPPFPGSHPEAHILTLVRIMDCDDGPVIPEVVPGLGDAGPVILTGIATVAGYATGIPPVERSHKSTHIHSHATSV